MLEGREVPIDGALLGVRPAGQDGRDRHRLARPPRMSTRRPAARRVSLADGAQPRSPPRAARSARPHRGPPPPRGRPGGRAPPGDDDREHRRRDQDDGPPGESPRSSRPPSPRSPRRRRSRWTTGAWQRNERARSGPRHRQHHHRGDQQDADDPHRRDDRHGGQRREHKVRGRRAARHTQPVLIGHDREQQAADPEDRRRRSRTPRARIDASSPSSTGKRLANRYVNRLALRPPPRLTEHHAERDARVEEQGERQVAGRLATRPQPLDAERAADGEHSAVQMGQMPATSPAPTPANAT